MKIKRNLLPFLLFCLSVMEIPSVNAQLLFPDSGAPFLPDLVSTKNAEVKTNFNSTGTKMLWGGIDRIKGKKDPDIRELHKINDQWAPAQPANFNSDSSDSDPFFAPDDSGIYFFFRQDGWFWRRCSLLSSV
ncbi:hypothetical protein A8C56_10415 [Niabella ginsenosidivorans]|uniref:Uncharacterized protein n=1 Tax=Niabella ginsenosidivorans TaxID=1176587 RepID=A0A1A9I3S2_9BACT|nr:hypothetical protein [Niabella ginsenosidivorans]ANH81342.1 hypothetical protein A8C56_10415 [Niabella ginsenosidivorans]